MPIDFGSLEAQDAHLGAAQVQAINLGGQQVWAHRLLPQITSFTCTPTQRVVGDAVGNTNRLAWTVANIDVLAQGHSLVLTTRLADGTTSQVTIGPGPNHYTDEVAPDQSAEYTLTATTPAGSTTAHANYTVGFAPAFQATDYFRVRAGSARSQQVPPFGQVNLEVTLEWRLHASPGGTGTLSGDGYNFGPGANATHHSAFANEIWTGSYRVQRQVGPRTASHLATYALSWANIFGRTAQQLAYRWPSTGGG